MKNVLITGANKGLGLGFVNVCLDKGYRVIAMCRNIDKANELISLKGQYEDNLILIQLDLASDTSINESYLDVCKYISSLDLLVNNAGINSSTSNYDSDTTKKLGSLNSYNLLDMFKINAVSPIILIQTYLDLLKKADKAKIINISSDRSSINRKIEGGNYGYSSSKTALNMLTKSLSLDLEPYGIVIASFHPGSVLTDMNKDHGKISPKDAALKILETMENFNKLKSGLFLDNEGNILPW